MNAITTATAGHAQRYLQALGLLALSVVLMLPGRAQSELSDWSMGVYGGRFYDTEPAGLVNGRASFLNQNMVALTASKTVWRSESFPLSLEIDGMIG